MTYQPHPLRIQRKRTRGWRMPDGAVYVGRPSRWGNPFRPAVNDTVEYAVAAFRALLTFDHQWFRSHGGYTDYAGFIMSYVLLDEDDVWELLEPLRGKQLACWCPLTRPCHADVLCELANRPRKPRRSKHLRKA